MNADLKKEGENTASTVTPLRYVPSSWTGWRLLNSTVRASAGRGLQDAVTLSVCLDDVYLYI